MLPNSLPPERILHLRKAIEQLGDGEAKDVLSQNFSSVGAILKYLLYARGMIIEELLAAKDW